MTNNSVIDIRRPIIGVGAVVWKGDEILLVRRAAPPLEGQWSIPGGKLEYGERSRDAALREVREETGVEAEILGLIDTVDAVIRHDDGRIDRHYVLIDFAARYVSGAPRAGGDAAEARWVAAAKSDELVKWNETRRIIGQSRKIVGIAG
ncbi:MAG: NUDIX hydrolase [Parvularculaceae bacterium]